MTTCKIYPSKLPNSIRNDPKRSAEIKLYDLFRDQLGSGWNVFYSVAWLSPIYGDVPRDGEADFIIAHPQKGVLIIEVKGGRIRYDGNRQQWISKDRHSVDFDIDPFEQVKRSKHALLEKLKTSPRLKNKWIHLCHAAAFPDVTKPTEAITLDSPVEIMIGMEDLNSLQDRINDILNYYQSDEKFTDGQTIVSELTRMLATTTELRNPLAYTSEEDDRQIIRLTGEQFGLLDHLSRIRRAGISGCAGSGKTFLAVEKARRLADEGFNTLLTCFNRPLAEHLYQLSVGTPNLKVCSFHTLCREFSEEAGIELPRADGINNAHVFQEDYPAALCEAIEQLPDNRFDAIIVDEGQDFEATWWVALEECLKGGKESIFYIFYDTHQMLYRGRGSLPDDIVEIPLMENIRNTRTIFNALVAHYRGEGSFKPRGPVGRTIEKHTYASGDELERILAKVLYRLLIVEGFSNRDLVVLTPRSLEKSALQKLRLPGALQLVSDAPKRENQHIQYSTVHRFKGLERKVVIIAELDRESFPSQNDQSMICYVAFSRARTHLILIGSQEKLSQLIDDVNV